MTTVAHGVDLDQMLGHYRRRDAQQGGSGAPLRTWE